VNPFDDRVLRSLARFLLRAGDQGEIYMTQRHDSLCALADSLPAAIRWRYCDYEQLLRRELEILLAPPVRLVWPPRGAAHVPPRCE
jgi:hypothetical protein